MGVTASGPPFDRPLCKCGWMWEDECKKLEKCGLNQGMPEYKEEYHTPYEFLSESAKEAAVNVVRDMIENSKSTHQVGGTHYAEMAVQPWDFYKSIFSPAGYCDYHVGSVISYLSRHRKKGGLQDLKKALHHMQELVNYFENEAEYE